MTGQEKGDLLKQVTCDYLIELMASVWLYFLLTTLESVHDNIYLKEKK